MPKLNLFLAEYNIFHVGCQNSACHLSHFLFRSNHEISDTSSLCRLRHIARTVTKMILHPKEAWHTYKKSQTCSNSTFAGKEAKSGIIQHKMVSHLRLFIRPQPKICSWGRRRLHRHSRNRRVIAKNTELNQALPTKHHGRSIMLNKMWWGGPRRRRWHFRYTPNRLQRRWFCWPQDDVEDTLGVLEDLYEEPMCGCTTSVISLNLGVYCLC
jgi:hypothetical protein